MTNAINKAEVVEALMKAAGPGKQTSREVDKVIAKINGGGFDTFHHIGEASDLDALQPNDMLAATRPESWEALDNLEYNRTLGEIIQAAVQAGVDGLQVVTNWIVVYESVEVDAPGDTQQFVTSPDADYIAHNSGSVAAAIGAMDIVKHRMLTVALTYAEDEEGEL